jgi:hypothetical protein
MPRVHVSLDVCPLQRREDDAADGAERLPNVLAGKHAFDYAFATGLKGFPAIGNWRDNRKTKRTVSQKMEGHQWTMGTQNKSGRVHSLKPSY